jgi:uncharacterized protein DUF7002
LNAEDVAKNFPLLYHMAWKGSWASIKRHGLLSTESLLDLFEITGQARTALLARKRPDSVPIKHRRYGAVVIRDQKPMNDRKLAGSLTGGLPLQTWYRMLNQRVFFWLTEDRLIRLMSADAYHDEAHDVLVIRTAPLVRDYRRHIRLTAMNTGATRPMAFPRGPDTFLRIRDYPFADRVKRRLEPIMELTVLGGIPDIRRYVERVERWNKLQRTRILYRA